MFLLRNCNLLPPGGRSVFVFRIARSGRFKICTRRFAQTQVTLSSLIHFFVLEYFHLLTIKGEGHLPIIRIIQLSSLEVTVIPRVLPLQPSSILPLPLPPSRTLLTLSYLPAVSVVWFVGMGVWI